MKKIACIILSIWTWSAMNAQNENHLHLKTGKTFSTFLFKDSEGGKEKSLNHISGNYFGISYDAHLGKRNVIRTEFGFRVDPFADIGESGIDREEFRKFGQSLIPFVSAGVSIRNQKEFDEYKSIITNPNASRAQIQGALQGLKQLMAIQLEEYGEELPSISESQEVISTPQGEIVEEQEQVDMQELPPASKHKGKIIDDISRGKAYKSDGKRWKEVK